MPRPSAPNAMRTIQGWRRPARKTRCDISNRILEGRCCTALKSAAVKLVMWKSRDCKSCARLIANAACGCSHSKKAGQRHTPTSFPTIHAVCRLRASPCAGSYAKRKNLFPGDGNRFRRLAELGDLGGRSATLLQPAPDYAMGMWLATQIGRFGQRLCRVRDLPGRSVQQLRQLGDVRGDAPRLVAGEEFGRRVPANPAP